MALEASWVPGYVAIPEIPGPSRLRQVNNIPFTDLLGYRVGGRAIFRLGYGQDNWFHFAIPTPVIDDGVRVRLDRFFVLYAAQPGVHVLAAHIWDGPNRKQVYNFDYTGNHSTAIDAQNSWAGGGDLVYWGVGISILVRNNGSADANIDFTSAGVDFGS
jgi:hypothetical protein